MFSGCQRRSVEESNVVFVSSACEEKKSVKDVARPSLSLWQWLWGGTSWCSLATWSMDSWTIIWKHSGDHIHTWERERKMNMSSDKNDLSTLPMIVESSDGATHRMELTSSRGHPRGRLQTASRNKHFISTEPKLLNRRRVRSFKCRNRPKRKGERQTGLVRWDRLLKHSIFEQSIMLSYIMMISRLY